MEEWQREFLKKNIDKLLEDTIVNAVLLAKLYARGILSAEDRQQIRSKATPAEQAWVLYDTVEKKRGAYAAMATALADTEQTGACEHFLQGYAYGFFKTSSINFLGQIKGLSEYLSEAEITDINHKIRTEHSLIQCINVYDNLLKDGHPITLVKELKLPRMPFYIPRMLLKRVVINKDLFQEDCNDVFVFKGVQSLVQLVGLVRPQRADWSGNQQEKLTSRFIQLQKEQHWANILEIAKVPIHLIKYEEVSDSFVLEQTRGASKVIRKYLQLPKVFNAETNCEHAAIVTEEKFIEDIINGSSSGVCICDSPGMGKTFLLARLANKLSKRYPTRLVAFIQMSRFIQHIKKHQNQNVYHTVLDYISASPIAKIILDKILKEDKIPLELLFDGFDEVQTQDNDFTKDMLVELTKNVPTTRVYVTARAHKRCELEVSLGVIAYDILPFSESEQISFLIKFWKNENSDGDEEKLGIFARRCLETVKSNFTSEERNMTGIPLTCRLLAQVYANKPKIYSTEDISVVESCKFEDSLPNLYTKYVEECFAKLDEREGAKIPIKEYHTWMALRIICPELQERYFQQFLANYSQMVVNLSLSVEILERRMNGNEETVEFVHRTLAEYFVCQFFAQILEESKRPGSFTEEFKIVVIKYLLEDVLGTKEINSEEEQYVFLNPNLAYFVNYFMKNISIPLTSQLMFRLFPNSVEPSQLSQMIFGCMRNNYANIFEIIKAILLCIDWQILQKYKSNVLSDGSLKFAVKLLNVASFYGDISMVDQLFAFFSECFAFDLKSVCRELPLEIDTPLHFAIERADAQMVQLFANLISLEGRNILLSCVLGSNEDSRKIISQKVEICKILLAKDTTLLIEANYTLSESVHVELLKVLIDAGADPSKTKLGKTVVHRAAKYMSSGDFHEFCRFLIVERKIENLFCSNNPKWKSLLLSIFRQQKNLSAATLEMILNIPGVDVNEKDGRGNTPFLLAVKDVQDEKILVVLAKARADINAVNVYGKNAPIVAAEAGNTSILPFLLSLPIVHCHRDYFGHTFLHALAIEKVTAEEYHTIVSLLASASLAEIFHVKSNKQELPVQIAVRYFEISNETLELFKTHDVDFSSVDGFGISLLMSAAFWKRSVKFMSALMEFGVDVNAQSRDGNTFAHIIGEHYSAEEYHEILQLLINKGHVAALQVKNKKGETPLHIAVFHIELLPDSLNLIRDQIVNQSEFNINCTDVHGNSLLMKSAKGKRSFQMLKRLIEMGVNLMIQDSYGDTFAHLVVMKYSAEEYHTIVELLVHKGHEKVFQVRNQHGNNPLHYAALNMEELLEKTLMLIKSKLILTGVVDISSTDNNGNSILISLAGGRHPGRAVSRDTPLRLIKWSTPDPNFLTYSSLQGGIKGKIQQLNTKSIKILIEMGADVMKQNKSGDTFAHYIPDCYSSKEYHDIVQLLIELKYEHIFAVRNYSVGETPFHCAVSNLNLLDSTLELLNLKVFQPKFADINTKDARGWTALMYAVLNRRSVEFLIRLINMGADVMAQDNHGNTFIHHFVSTNYSAKQFHQILDFLDNRNYLSVFKIANKEGINALHRALCFIELVDETIELFKSKIIHPGIVDVNVTNKHGITLLLSAAMGKRSIKVLKLLIEAGADTSVQGENGYTFAHFIPAKYSAEQYHNILEILFEKGGEKTFQVVNKYGETPFHCAVCQLELLPETLSLINSKVIQSGIVDINLRRSDGNSLLCCAALGKRSITFLKTLLEMGVDAMNKNNKGYTFAHLVPLFYSPEEYHHILELLIEKGHEKIFTALNKKGMTPVHNAIMDLELLEETLQLLNFTIFQTNILDINSTDHNGYSFLMYAVSGRRGIRVLKALIGMGVSVMMEDINSNTFAHSVAQIYSPEECHHIYEFIIEKGYEKVFTSRNKNGLTPVHIALANLDLLEETLQLLNSTIFQTNILDINSTDPNGNSFLVYAARGRRSIRVLNALIEVGVSVVKENINGNTFAHLVTCHYSAEEYHEILGMLLEKGYEEAFKNLNVNGWNPLHIAVGELEILDVTLGMINSRIFQTNIVNINSTDKNGNSLLHNAVFGKRSVRFLARLMELGVDVSIANKQGQTFAHVIPAYYNNEDYHKLLVLLIVRGHEHALHTVDNNEMTPLLYAVYQLEFFPETLCLFIISSRSLKKKRNYLKRDMGLSNAIPEHSPGFQDHLNIFLRAAYTMFQQFSPQQKQSHYLDAVTKDGSSVLHWALIGKRSMQFVKHLVNLGADWSVLSNHKSSLAHCSAFYGLIEHLKYFVELGCDVNALDNDGDNVLHCAVLDATENIYEMVIFLVEKGADILHKNKKGRTAHDYALEKGIMDNRILNALDIK